jgi:hypothetical protein
MLGGMPNTARLKQGDDRWSADLLGFGPSTLGGSGCLLVALCEAARILKVHAYLDPRELNTRGQAAKTFAGVDKASGKWIVGIGSGALIPALAACAGLEVDRSRRKEVAVVGADSVRTTIKTALGQGELVLLNVDHDSTRKGGDEHPDHWVLAFAMTADVVSFTDAATGKDGSLSLASLTGLARWGTPPRIYKVMVAQPVRRLPVPA